MILPLLLGIGLIIWGLVTFKKFIIFSTGLKIKGTVTTGRYKEQGATWRKMMLAEITYTYHLDDQKYSNTEISDRIKHQHKTRSMRGEKINILVNKNNHSMATIRSSLYYLKSSIIFLLMGLIVVLVSFT